MKPTPYGKWAPFVMSPEDEAEIAALTCEDRAVGHEAARQLRRLCRLVQPKVIIEVGTYVGMSTRAMVASEVIYTCDSGPKRTKFAKDGPRIVTHWETYSYSMLRQLVAANVRAELVFYDGKVHANDVELLRQLTTRDTVYAFHDFINYAKGVKGVRALWGITPRYDLVVPASEHATIAVLAPQWQARELVLGDTDGGDE